MLRLSLGWALRMLAVNVPPTLAPPLMVAPLVAVNTPLHIKPRVSTGLAKRMPRASGKNVTATLFEAVLVSMLRVSVALIFDAVMVPPT